MKNVVCNCIKILPVILFLLYLLFIIYIPLSPYDELWDFHNVFKMCNDLELYVNANVITTPLFFYLAYMFVKCFGATAFSFRIFNIFFILLQIILIYLILKKLDMSRGYRILRIIYNTCYCIRCI